MANRQEWQRRSQAEAPSSPSDLSAIRHNEITLLLRELLIKMNELLADRERDHARFEGDHK